MHELMKRLVTPAGKLTLVLILTSLLALWSAVAATQQLIEKEIRNNFTAVGLLSKLQIEGERMRRFEKEAFIYVSEVAARERYVAQFDRTYGQLLALLDTMQAPSSANFSDDERREMARWKDAALFYGTEFASLGHRAANLDGVKGGEGQRSSRTIEFNDAIAAGKDRFRLLLDGAQSMRVQREAAAHRVAGDIGDAFWRLRLGLLLGGSALMAMLFHVLRPRRNLSADVQVLHA